MVFQVILYPNSRQVSRPCLADHSWHAGWSWCNSMQRHLHTRSTYRALPLKSFNFMATIWQSFVGNQDCSLHWFWSAAGNESEGWLMRSSAWTGFVVWEPVMNNLSKWSKWITLHNCFGTPAPCLLVEDLVSTGPTPSSSYLLVEMGLPLHLYSVYS